MVCLQCSKASEPDEMGWFFIGVVGIPGQGYLCSESCLRRWSATPRNVMPVHTLSPAEVLDALGELVEKAHE